MLAWVQHQVASVFGVILIFVALIGAVAIGNRAGGESTVLRWGIGIAAFVLLLLILAPIFGALQTI
jgi:hypothetical protein